MYCSALRVAALVLTHLQVLDVIHPGRANVPKAELKKHIATMFKVEDEATIMIFGFKTKFGGGKSTGFGLIYDSLDAVKKFEPRYRLVRVSAALSAAGRLRLGLC